MGEGGACTAVGIQTCAELFVDPVDGLCKPSTSRCDPGEIPVFAQGCVAVGISGCASMFMDEESGLCKPSIDHCAPGEIPMFSEGCRAVGVPGCAAEFVDPETGLCVPNPSDCAPGTAAVPTSGCRSVDPVGGCGEGPWGNVEALDGDVYVDLAYDGGDSDGTRERPWTLIGYALSEVQDGGRVVLAAGEYDSGILFSKSFELVGRCASMVSIMGVRSGDFGATVLEAKGAVDIAVSDVRVAGPGMGAVIQGGATANLDRVWLTGSLGVGLLVTDPGTTVTVREVLIEAMETFSDGSFGMGIQASSGATLNLYQGAILDGRQTAVVVADPNTTVHMEDILVARTKSLPNGTHGEGVQVTGGAQLSLLDVVIAETRDEGLLMRDSGTQVTGSRVVVANTQPIEAVTSGVGIAVNIGAALSLEDSAVIGNRNIGLYVIDPGATASVTSSLFAHQMPAGDGSGGVGFHVEAGGVLTGESVTVAHNLEFGVYARGYGTSVDLSDSLITRTSPDPEGELGWGVQLIDGATVTLTGCALLENTGLSAIADKPGSVLTLNESIVADTLPPSFGGSGRGIQVTQKAWLFGDRLAVVDNKGLGIIGAMEGSRVQLSRAMVSRTRSTDLGYEGRGMQVQDLAEATVSDSTFAYNREFAAVVFAGTGTFTRTLFEGTTAGVGDGYGDGLAVLSGGNIIGENLVSRGQERAGLLINESNATVGGTVGLENHYGLVIQGGLAPLIQDDNHFADNSENIVKSSSLKVPDQPLEMPEPPDTKP